jgi:hypothetical protein
VLVLGGCGSPQAQEPMAQPAVASGQEAPVAPPPEPTPEPAAAQEPSGPAAITVEAKVHGKAVDANVRLLGADGSEVAAGKTGQALSVQSGEYEMQVQITDAAAMLDKPTQKRSLTLHAGDNLHEGVDFPWAMIQLNVMVNGRLEKNASVKLMRQGTEVGTVKSGAEPVPISPGRYEAEARRLVPRSKSTASCSPRARLRAFPSTCSFK